MSVPSLVLIQNIKTLILKYTLKKNGRNRTKHIVLFLINKDKDHPYLSRVSRLLSILTLSALSLYGR